LRDGEVSRSGIETAQYGKNKTPVGITPAVALVNPKYPHNVGAAVRAASCFGVKQVWFSGNRVSLSPTAGSRLPREERMKGYREVELRQFDYFFDQFPDATPVAVELRPNSEQLPDFEHPENPLYVFGPEDGSIPQVMLRHCHRFVVIPTRHCVNLSAAVYMVLYDRLLKRYSAGCEERLPMSEILAEPRGFLSLLDEDLDRLVVTKE
jgi:tRNA(Leu) C34 or U34 (ribose-2'-O)-methylase TrmL